MSDPWFRFFPSDWLSGVSSLSAAERGVYITILAIIYDHGGPVPRDDARLSRQCGIPKAGFVRAVEGLLLTGKLTEEQGCLCNSRAKNELTERENRKLIASDAARSRWEKGKGKQHCDDAAASPEQCEVDATRAPVPQPQPHSSNEEYSHPSDVRSAGEPAPKRSERKTPVAEIREILETCLPSQLAQDLIDHRKAKRSPLTTGAARLLAKQFTDFGQPVIAAQTMIARGWQGFRPEWMANDARAGPGQQPTRNGMHAVHAKLHGLDRSRHDESDFENPFSPTAGASQPGNIKSGRGLPEPGRDEPGGEVVDLVKDGTTWG